MLSLLIISMMTKMRYLFVDGTLQENPNVIMTAMFMSGYVMNKIIMCEH